MSKSIISNEYICFKDGCNSNQDLHRHHIYFGRKNRRLSEKYGCWVYLCGYHHNLSNEGVHFKHDFDLELKELCQRKWEKHDTRENFIKVFGKNYL